MNADEQERIMIENEMIETNDWVEVVRCKDCKYYIKPTTNPHDNSDWYMCKFFDHLMDDNDFCSRGERRK